VPEVSEDVRAQIRASLVEEARREWDGMSDARRAAHLAAEEAIAEEARRILRDTRVP
jgi:hypothetical protein